MFNTESCSMQIKQINDAIEKYANSKLRENDLSLTQTSVLIELDDSEDRIRSLKWLERRFSVAQPTMLGIVNRLEQKGLVTTFANPDDKRVKMVHLTETGHYKCACGYTYMNDTETILLEALSPDEQLELKRLLKKIKIHLQK